MNKEQCLLDIACKYIDVPVEEIKNQIKLMKSIEESYIKDKELEKSLWVGVGCLYIKDTDKSCDYINEILDFFDEK